MRFAQIKFSRADEVADILDKENGVFLGFDCLDRALHHLGIEVAAFPGIDLKRPHARRADSRRVVRCFLVAFNHSAGNIRERPEGLRQKFGLPGPGARNEVER